MKSVAVLFSQVSHIKEKNGTANCALLINDISQLSETYRHITKHI